MHGGSEADKCGVLDSLNSLSGLGFQPGTNLKGGGYASDKGKKACT